MEWGKRYRRSPLLEPEHYLVFTQVHAIAVVEA